MKAFRIQAEQKTRLRRWALRCWRIHLLPILLSRIANKLVRSLKLGSRGGQAAAVEPEKWLAMLFDQ